MKVEIRYTVDVTDDTRARLARWLDRTGGSIATREEIKDFFEDYGRLGLRELSYREYNPEAPSA